MKLAGHILRSITYMGTMQQLNSEKQRVHGGCWGGGDGEMLVHGYTLPAVQDEAVLGL